MRALAIDFGGSHATCAVVEDASILTSRVQSNDGHAKLGEFLPSIADCLHSLLERCRLLPGNCKAVVMGFCGLVDSDHGRVLSTNGKYDDAPGLDLSRWANDAFGLPFRIENDARLALLGEQYAGAARGSSDIVMMTLGTGVGGAAMIGGHLLRGKHFQAGCLGGHFPVEINGRRCTCGNVGCVEAEASTWALPEICRSCPGFECSLLRDETKIDFSTLFGAIDAGDRFAEDILSHCTRVWGAGAVSLVHAYDPEIVVVGGGVMSRWPMIIPGIREYVSEHAWTPWGKVEVRAAELGNNGALLGAIPLLKS